MGIYVFESGKESSPCPKSRCTVQMLSFDSECAAQAARIRVNLEAAGTLIGPHDTLIAATALRHQAILVTRNVREFSRVPGLQWLNWHDST